jgi:hypothetical protein
LVSVERLEVSLVRFEGGGGLARIHVCTNLGEVSTRLIVVLGSGADNVSICNDDQQQRKHRLDHVQ